MNGKRKQPSIRKLILFRLLAIGIGLSPFFLAEVCLHFATDDATNRPQLPAVEFVNQRSLFERNDKRGVYEIPKRRQGYFRPEAFPLQKPDETSRIFCLGGSTVQGRPYAIETSFTTWLEIALNETDDSRKWNVINCGGVSYASYRLLPILEEVLDYEPDLVLLYTGHNEFLEDRTYGHLKPYAKLTSDSTRWLGKSRLIQTLQGVFVSDEMGSSSQERIAFPNEVDAVLDYERGLEFYRRDPAWRRGVQLHFRENVLEMIQLCHEAGVPLLICNPVRNLRDCPPFKSADTSGLSRQTRKRLEKLEQELAGERNHDLSAWREMVELNPEHAGYQYGYAQRLAADSRWKGAEEHFVRACDEDICPLRILSGMQHDLQELASENGVPLIDMAKMFAERSEHGLCGDRWFLDHVHPSIEGHQLMAMQILETLVNEEMIFLREENISLEAFLDVYQEHLEKLDPLYFAKGQQRLKNLQAWAAGRGKKIQERQGSSE